MKDMQVHLETIHDGGLKVNKQIHLLVFKPMVFRNTVLPLDVLFKMAGFALQNSSKLLSRKN